MAPTVDSYLNKTSAEFPAINKTGKTSFLNLNCVFKFQNIKVSTYSWSAETSVPTFILLGWVFLRSVSGLTEHYLDKSFVKHCVLPAFYTIKICCFSQFHISVNWASVFQPSENVKDCDGPSHSVDVPPFSFTSLNLRVCANYWVSCVTTAACCISLVSQQYRCLLKQLRPPDSSNKAALLHPIQAII